MDILEKLYFLGDFLNIPQDEITQAILHCDDLDVLENGLNKYLTNNFTYDMI